MRCPPGNAENNILNKILTVNKVMSFSGLFLLKILNVAQGHNSKKHSEKQFRPGVARETGGGNTQ